MSEEIVRETYLLINNPGAETETTKLHDGTEAKLINQEKFSIKKVPINNIITGDWFVFVEPTEVNGNHPCVSVGDNGQFIYLCVKNNNNGSVDAKTTFLSLEQKLEIIGKINKMLEEETN